jgi:hypothetical protein
LAREEIIPGYGAANARVAETIPASMGKGVAVEGGSPEVGGPIVMCLDSHLRAQGETSYS